MLSNYFFNNNYKVQIIYTRISPNIKRKLNSNINLKKTSNFFSLDFLNPRVNNAINFFLYSLINIKFDKNSILFSMQDYPFGIILSIVKNVHSIIRIANHHIGSL